jgi:hypothetical protein
MRRTLFLTLLSLLTIANIALVSHVAAGPAVNSQATPVQTITAPTSDACKKDFLGLKPWFYYLNREFSSKSAPKAATTCDIKCFNIFVQTTPNECGKTNSDIPGVLLAVIDDLLRLAGLIALAFIFVGAFKYVTSQGNPDDTASAQSTLVNAFTGLAISVVAVAFVSFIASRLGG